MRFERAWAAALGLALLSAAPAQGQSVADFYRGKTIDLYIGFTQGGGYDLYARAVGRAMTNHIPGNPRIIPRQMTGAGSLTATNHVYNIAPKDGTVLATADQALPVNQVVNDPAVKYDAGKFAWIGNANADVNITMLWHEAGIRSIEDAKRREVSLGATGPAPNTSALYPLIMNKVLGTRFKIITGYPGGADIDLALERREVDGRGSNAWASLKSTKPDWIRDKKVVILTQIGLVKAKDLPEPPLLLDLAPTASDRALFKLLSATTTVGRPIFSTPSVPQDRVDALRKAFDDTMRDAAFLAEAQREGLDINPIPGAELQKIVQEMLATPKEVANRLQAIIEGKE